MEVAAVEAQNLSLSLLWQAQVLVTVLAGEMGPVMLHHIVLVQVKGGSLPEVGGIVGGGVESGVVQPMVQEEAEATAGLESTTSNVTVEDSAPMPVEDPGTVPMTSHEETAPITIPESLPPPPPPKRMRRGTDIDFLREEVVVQKAGYSE
ncbi:unnamed protein product [Gadus morhua 'NCC']